MFDKTQSLVALASYEIIKDLTFSSTFLYSTGAPVTLPEAYYNISGVNFPYWEGRNKYRLPDYHRLDLGINYEPDFLAIKIGNQHIKTGMEISLYNVYNRRNVRSIGMTEGGTGSTGKDGLPLEQTGPQFQQNGISTYGFMPSFQISFNF